MLRPPVVRAAALAVLLAGASPPLARAAGHPPPRAVLARPSTFKEIWSSLRRLVAFLGHVDPNGLLDPTSGQQMDPDGRQSTTPDSGQEMDPNG
jgi:hypothetical protein